jgi:uncharacterized protein YdeI (YjbR/CyaY-like superfamily)
MYAYASMAKQKRFKTSLVKLRSNLGWTVAYIPFNVETTWNTRGMLKVKVEVNGQPFRTSLFPTREGKHFILVNKKMQKAAKIKIGSIADFRIEPDTEERVARVPPELTPYFRRDAPLRRWYEKLNYSMRREIDKWISEPTSSDARKRRAEQIAERLLSTMEAEAELPPQVRIALESTPNALAGWKLLTDGKRRMELMAFFYYRTPASRTKRLEKTVQLAVAAAERTGR